MIQLLKMIIGLSNRLKKDHVNAYAAQASYFIIISIFPFIMLLLTMIQFTPLTKSDLLSSAIGITPNAFDPIMINIIEEMYTKAAPTIISISAIGAVWSASKSILAIMRGLNSVFHINETRNYLVVRLLAAFYIILFILIIIFSLTLLVFGNRLQLFLSKHSPIVHEFTLIIISSRTIIGLCILTFFFMLLYRLVPNENYSLIELVPGSLFAAAGWMLYSFCFSLYIDNYAGTSYMYGSLTLFVLLMLWVYFCMYIMFIGAEINVYFEGRIGNFFFHLREKRKGIHTTE